MELIGEVVHSRGPQGGVRGTEVLLAQANDPCHKGFAYGRIGSVRKSELFSVIEF